MPTREKLFLGNNNLTADNQTKNLAKELYKTMSKKQQPLPTMPELSEFDTLLQLIDSITKPSIK